MNLITNAADAIGDKRGSITISAELIQATHGFFAEAYLHDKIMEGAYICLKVADTGIGMDPATKERIFDPFFTTKSTGRGLGLSALLGIVRAHHGTLKIDSEKGKGTTFSIFLPATKEEASANIEDDQRALQAWRANGCVLVVDDEPAVCAVAKRMLEESALP